MVWSGNSVRAMGRGVLCLLLGLLTWLPGAAQDKLSAQAVVEKQQVSVGEPFLYQIRVDGSESPKKPDLGALTGFSVQDMGGSRNSSQSVTIVNGRMTRVVQRGYVFTYRLTPTKQGILTIPAVAITAEGRTVRTVPIQIRAVPPRETKDFKLRLRLSAAKVYLGQPVIMTLTWYVGKNVRSVALTVPVLADNRFKVEDLPTRAPKDRLLQVQVGDQVVVAEKGMETLDGRDFMTVRFQKVLTPKTAGKIVFPQATVAGQAVKAYQRRRSIFDEMFDQPFFGDPGFGRQAVYENFVVPSNRPSLEVLPLPAAGRPANFTGLVGQYKIAAKATPTKVNVGDPITLTLKVSGPRFLGNVELPSLAGQPALKRDFKIPEEMAAGEVKDHEKVFTQTLRATHPDVEQIPPIELPYFDPRDGSYKVARTAPIPLEVHGTRVVTARDAEGAAAAVEAGSEVESSHGGIRANYEGPDVLTDQAFGPGAWVRNPGIIAGLAIPPLIYLGLFGFTTYERRRNADPEARRARAAYRNFTRALKSLRPSDSDEFYAALLEALRTYCGDRLGLTSGAVTFADVEPPLQKAGAGGETVESLRRLFERCEAGRYAGAAFGDQDPAALRESARQTVARIDEALR